MRDDIDFSTFAKWLAENWKLAISAVAPPSLFGFAGFAPPWPDSTGAAACIVAVILSLLGAIAAFALGEKQETSRRNMLIAAIGTIVCLGVYLAFWSQSVRSWTQNSGTDDQSIRTFYIKGTSLKVETHGKTENEIFAIYSFDPDRVYTAGPLLENRLVMLSSFGGIFFFLTVALGCTAFVHRAEASPP